MDNKQKSALAVAVAASLGGVGVAEAVSVDVLLISAPSYSSNGASNPNLSSSTATWSYNTVSGVLTQTGGTYNARFTTAPFTTLFRHTMTGAILGNAPATGSTYACVEGGFGATVGASLCGNYGFGANFANNSLSTWGPGTAAAKTILGDDVNYGPIQAINAYNYFATTSFDGILLRIGNASCNVYAPGNANGCAASGGFNTGNAWTLSTVPVPGAVWLFGSALGLLGVARRRATKA